MSMRRRISSSMASPKAMSWSGVTTGEGAAVAMRVARGDGVFMGLGCFFDGGGVGEEVRDVCGVDEEFGAGVGEEDVGGLVLDGDFAGGAARGEGEAREWGIRDVGADEFAALPSADVATGGVVEAGFHGEGSGLRVDGGWGWAVGGGAGVRVGGEEAGGGVVEGVEDEGEEDEGGDEGEQLPEGEGWRVVIHGWGLGRW